jgi:hypothetical protein
VTRALAEFDRQLALALEGPQEPVPPPTTEETWRLAKTREELRQALGEGDDACRAARNIFDAFCLSADYLVRKGLLEDWPRWLKGA